MSTPERLGRISQGKFEILGKGAVGGMGEVYAVRHRLLGELRAVKIMRAASASDPHLQERFMQEARTAARLRHPNLVQLFDLAFHDDGTAYMVLEWIEGLDLAKLLRQYGPPPLADALSIARQSLDALGYLHGEGIVHRDISTDNLMVSQAADGGLEVKIIDLGIAKSIKHPSGLTRKGLFVGKLHYSAPETLEAKRRDSTPDPRSDLYSFGVVLYEMLTGEGPFVGDGEAELVAAHLLQAPRPFEQTDRHGRVPADLRAVVLKALQKEPGDRFQSAAELAAALAAVETPREDASSAAGLRRTVAGATSVGPQEVSATTIELRQTELDKAFRSEPTRPAAAGSAVKEAWFDDLRRSYVRRQQSRRRSSLVYLLQEHPKPVLGIATLLVVLFVGYATFLRGGEGPQEPAATPASRGPGVTAGPAVPPDEPPLAAAGHEAESTAKRPPEASPDPSPQEPRQAVGGGAVALISDNAQLTAIFTSRFGGSLPLVAGQSLGEAEAAAARGGPRRAVLLSAVERSGALEAYDTQVAVCVAVVSGQVLALPGGRILAARSVEATAPLCGEAVARSGRLLADRLASELTPSRGG